MESLKRPNRISNAMGPMPGALFFCGPAGEHQIHQHQEAHLYEMLSFPRHSPIIPYHSLSFPVIDASVTPGPHPDPCIP